MKFSLKLFGGTVVGLLLAVSALAQTFPAKPVTLMVPYPAGGVSDVIARTLNVTLSKHLGQPVIVENLGGGGWRHCGAKGTQCTCRRPHHFSRGPQRTDSGALVQLCREVQERRVPSGPNDHHQSHGGARAQGPARE